MKARIINLLSLGLILSLMACSDDDSNTPAITIPDSYTFERNGSSTVAFAGQTSRIQMAEELAGNLKNFEITADELLEMYRNSLEDGSDANPFSSQALNEATVSIKSKVAASKDYFSTNTSVSALLKQDFENWINLQVTEVFPNSNTVALPGVSGQIADGSSVRYVNEHGLEYDQMIVKGLIGALMLDQISNNYLSTSVLDEADNVEKNNNDEVEVGKAYTTMEHKWDEAYGYVYGNSADKANPNATIGADDSYLNKYIGRAENDSDFAGVADEIFNAFKLGRAAILAKQYTVRDQQAEIIREKLSEIIAVRAVFYLVQGKNGLPTDRENFALYGPTFHDLSEGYGFIYSLQFTRMPGTNEPYFTHDEVNTMLAKLLGDGPNGLWDVEPSTLDELATEIASKFDFTIDQAGS